MRRSSARSCSTPESTATCGRSSFRTPTVGGIVDRYPRVHQGWTGDNVGDFYVGAKVNFWSEVNQKPVALAVRGIVKLPTGDDEAGVSTGKTDFAVDFIASKKRAA